MPIRKISYISICATLTCVLTFIYLPTPWGIPITGQTLAILVTGLILSPIDATISVGLYLNMGIIGLPVFSGAQSGIGVFFGPTGGYLSSFLLAVFILSFFAKRNKPVLGVILFSTLVYLVGSLQLSIVTNITFFQALKVGVLPFLPGDFIKTVIAFAVVKRIPFLEDVPKV